MSAPLATAAAAAPEASAEEIKDAFATTKAYFRSGATRSLTWRLAQLKAIKAMLLENRPAINAAVLADLRRPKFEAEIGETISVVGEIDEMIDNLAEWMKPVAVPTPLLQKPSTSYILKDPKGVVLILGAWNFPIALTVLPLASAIAGGNTAVVKPSEVSPASASLVADLISRYLDPQAVRVVLGGAAQSTLLLAQPYNHIFYTGGCAVGSIVMAAAAKNLTPVTLELGGKSPVIVAKDANLAVAARRILSTKFTNCGQVCIAPDYVLVDASVEDKLIAEMKSTLKAFFGENPQASPDLGRVVNGRHFDRLSALLTSHRGEIVVGGTSDKADLYIAPTIVKGVDPASPLMQEEIFGPILPIVSVASIDDAIEFVNERPQPLALYVYTASSSVSGRVLSLTTSGGACVNDSLMHYANPNLPFGGVGPSGLGSYHGKFGFDTFTHSKAVLAAKTWSDPALRYPPYSDKALGVVTWLASAKLRFPFGKPGVIVTLALIAYAVATYAKKH